MLVVYWSRLVKAFPGCRSSSTNLLVAQSYAKCFSQRNTKEKGKELSVIAFINHSISFMSIQVIDFFIR